jgi:hypothetical protein
MHYTKLVSACGMHWYRSLSQIYSSFHQVKICQKYRERELGSKNLQIYESSLAILLSKPSVENQGEMK